MSQDIDNIIKIITDTANLEDIRQHLDALDQKTLDSIVKTIPFNGDYPVTNMTKKSFIIKYRDLLNDDSGENLPIIKKHKDNYQQDIFCLETNSSRFDNFKNEGMLETPADGDCFFHCISNLVELTFSQHKEPSYYRVNILKMLKQMIDNNFINTNVITSNNISINDYFKRMLKDGEWAGELEIKAACNLFHHIIIIKSERRNTPDLYYFPEVRDRLPGLWILYHVHTNRHHSNQIGNHYNYNHNIKKGTIVSLNELERFIEDVSFSNDIVDYSTTAEAFTKLQINEDNFPMVGSAVDIENYSNYLKEDDTKNPIQTDENSSSLMIPDDIPFPENDDKLKKGISSLIEKLKAGK